MKTSNFSRMAAGCSTAVMLVVGMLPQVGLSQDPFLPPPGPPVRIVSPANYATFYQPVDVPVFTFTHAIRSSEAAYVGIEFTNVEIYATNTLTLVGTDLGPAKRLDATTELSFIDYNHIVPPGWLTERFHATWCLIWSNAPLGSYVLTAVASGREVLTDSLLKTNSQPVNISILSSTTGTNPTNIVSIVATDPIAVAGTNMSWIWPGLTNALPAWTNWPPPSWGYFTNWGPKPALFTVRRFGNASSNLTVNYQTGGTASNGVDYLALPGYINIPAGAGYGLIPVIPVDNGSNNLIKTVVLTLTPATNTPTYIIGFPPRAEGLIFYRWPRPIPVPLVGVPPPVGSFLPDGAFHLNAAGPDGAWFAVQNSPDLVNWTPICTNQVVDGSVDVGDPNAAGNPSGFYQVVPLTNSPPQ